MIWIRQKCKKYQYDLSQVGVRLKGTSLYGKYGKFRAPRLEPGADVKNKQFARSSRTASYPCTIVKFGVFSIFVDRDYTALREKHMSQKLKWRRPWSKAQNSWKILLHILSY